MLTHISGVVLVVILIIYAATYVLSHKPRTVFKSEQKYQTITTEGKISEPLPLLAVEKQSHEDVYLSVVIPVYNETKRLKSMLIDAFPVLKQLNRSFEIIIVDDKSNDGSAEFALQLALDEKFDPETFRVIQLFKNRGKGGAISHGMRFARGSYVLFADADGASEFSDISRLLDAVKINKGVAIGSRAHKVNTKAVLDRSPIRNFLMHTFHLLVWLFGVRTVQDTQCGFKLFTRSASMNIFPYIHNEGWIFDVEVLMLAQKKGYSIAEVPISWHEVEGSKINLALDSIKMTIDLIVTRLAYIFSIYNDCDINFVLE